MTTELDVPCEDAALVLTDTDVAIERATESSEPVVASAIASASASIPA